MLRSSRRTAGPLVVALALLLVTGGFVLALLAAHVTAPGYRAQPATTASPAPSTATPTVPPPTAHRGSDGAASRPLHEVGNLVLGMYAAAVLTALLACGYLLLRALSTRTGRRSRERSATPGVRGYDLQPDLVAQQLAEAAAAGLDELDAEGPVADVIIACWQRLRAAAGDAGVPPVASDTPEQAIGRVLRAGAVSEAAERPLAVLAGLYREARFSAHEMSRGDVWVARQALQAILAQLHPEVTGAR
jgi:hypothetical protein